MSDAITVYRPWGQDRFEWALPSNGDAYETLVTLGRDSVRDTWTPIDFKILTEDEIHNSTRHRADMPWLGGHVLVLRGQAIDEVGPILLPYGEILPLRCENERLALFHCMNFCAALNVEDSDVTRFPSSPGKIMDIGNAVFHRGLISGPAAFRMAEMPRGAIFLTEDLVQIMQATGLTAGTTFRAVGRAR